nr:mechanosensitive ion channel family protein [Candidatus Woesearchaeota archaeon]
MVLMNIFLTDFVKGLIPFQNIYLRALIIFFLITLFLYIVIFLIDRVVKTLFLKTKTTLDDELFSAVEKPFYAIAFLAGLWFGIDVLGINQSILMHINRLLMAFILFVLFFPVHRITNILINYWFGKYTRRIRITVDEKLLPVLNRAVKIIYFIIFILFILRLYQVDVGPLLASLGIAGLAVGLALQDTLKNIFSGASIISDKSIGLGDRIKLESGESGIVRDIGLRTTRIETPDKEIIIVPNSQLANNRVLNYSLPNLRTRVNVDVDVGYGVDIDKVKKLLLDCVKVLDKDAVDNSKDIGIYFMKMGEFSLTFRLVVPINDVHHKFSIESKLKEEIYKRLRKSKIEIPFPTRTIYVKK